MNTALYTALILISFVIAFLGVMVLFNHDTLIGFILALGGITLSLRIINNV